MIQLSETLALHSVEEALSPEELRQLRKIADNEPRPDSSVTPAPALARDILDAAVERALPSIQRHMPSVRRAASWMYVELRAGLHVATHVDGIPDPGAPLRRLARISVTLEQADAGGDFYVETTSSPCLWTGVVVGEREGFAPGTPLTHALPHTHEHNHEASWLARTPRTRWTTDAAPGVFLAYGAQILHGVTPVRSGTLRKFVADLVDATD
ncbi:hypothetical protein [Streptomyces sp. LNU-CPARS28]|uniref:hypothetical protein n=1 Tax=Streptomyces sp. LNU-CPARS28 TaxID=3137371 RepID=UPI0031355E3A